MIRASLLLAFLAALARCWPPQPPRPMADAPVADVPAEPQPVPQFATSEEAVVFAFERWAAEQQEDGSWGLHDEAGQAIEPATTETTALVLLALAGAGQTHRQGKYRDQVLRGLDYLRNAGEVDHELAPQRLILPAHGQTTRSQALATLALCRVYSMTRDSQCQRAAQFAVNELCRPEHRPNLKTEDTEVVCWELLALVEGHQAYLTVTPGAAIDLQKWYAARTQSLPQSAWQANEFIGIRRFGLMTADQFKSPIRDFIQRRVDQQAVQEQFATATAFVEINYAEVGEPLQRLKANVLSQFAREASLSELALRVMILQSRLHKFPSSMNDPEDDFPLMSRHEDL